MKLKQVVVGFVIGSILVLGACGKAKEDKGIKITSKTEVSSSKPTKKVTSKEAQENSGLGNYTGLRIGDTVSVINSEVFEGKQDFDFTLNNLVFTDRPLNGKEPKYESGFVIADITIKNTGKEEFDIGLVSNLTIGPAIFRFGLDYGFESLDDTAKIPVGESQTGKMVARFSKLEDQLTWGLEGFSTTFSYDIKPEDYGEYVAE